jgi:hypothetical protein
LRRLNIKVMAVSSREPTAEPQSRLTEVGGGRKERDTAGDPAIKEIRNSGNTNNISMLTPSFY